MILSKQIILYIDSVEKCKQIAKFPPILEPEAHYKRIDFLIVF